LALYVPGIGTPAPRYDNGWDRLNETVQQMFGFGIPESATDLRLEEPLHFAVLMEHSISAVAQHCVEYEPIEIAHRPAIQGIDLDAIGQRWRNELRCDDLDVGKLSLRPPQLGRVQLSRQPETTFGKRKLRFGTRDEAGMTVERSETRDTSVDPGTHDLHLAETRMPPKRMDGYPRVSWRSTWGDGVSLSLSAARQPRCRSQPAHCRNECDGSEC
jgi:hypothetical protein